MQRREVEGLYVDGGAPNNSYKALLGSVCYVAGAHGQEAVGLVVGVCCGEVAD